MAWNIAVVVLVAFLVLELYLLRQATKLFSDATESLIGIMKALGKAGELMKQREDQ